MHAFPTLCSTGVRAFVGWWAVMYCTGSVSQWSLLSSLWMILLLSQYVLWHQQGFRKIKKKLCVCVYIYIYIYIYIYTFNNNKLNVSWIRQDNNILLRWSAGWKTGNPSTTDNDTSSQVVRFKFFGMYLHSSYWIHFIWCLHNIQ